MPKRRHCAWSLDWTKEIFPCFTDERRSKFGAEIRVLVYLYIMQTYSAWDWNISHIFFLSKLEEITETSMNPLKFPGCRRDLQRHQRGLSFSLFCVFTQKITFQSRALNDVCMVVTFTLPWDQGRSCRNFRGHNWIFHVLWPPNSVLFAFWTHFSLCFGTEKQFRVSLPFNWKGHGPEKEIHWS